MSNQENFETNEVSWAYAWESCPAGTVRAQGNTSNIVKSTLMYPCCPPDANVYHDNDDNGYCSKQ